MAPLTHRNPTIPRGNRLLGRRGAVTRQALGRRRALLAATDQVPESLDPEQMKELAIAEIVEDGVAARAAAGSNRNDARNWRPPAIAPKHRTNP
jgi:hypothetical protein